MGWTSTHYNSNEGLRKFFEKELTGDTENFSWKLLDFAALKYGTECYAAIEKTNKLDGTKYVFGMAIMCIFSPKSQYNITYKEMDETEGPNIANCPLRILDKLSEPPLNQYAADWRKRCRANAGARSQQSKTLRNLKPGDIVKFRLPLHFTNGANEDTFLVDSVSPLRFIADGLGFRCRISQKNFRPGEYTVIPEGGLQV